MASKKKSAAKKTATGKKGAQIRNLTKEKKTMTAEQLQAVKGGWRKLQ
jgi:bacteriocin-like protein